LGAVLEALGILAVTLEISHDRRRAREIDFDSAFLGAKFRMRNMPGRGVPRSARSVEDRARLLEEDAERYFEDLYRQAEKLGRQLSSLLTGGIRLRIWAIGFLILGVALSTAASVWSAASSPAKEPARNSPSSPPATTTTS
jgi:hypothetical protein